MKNVDVEDILLSEAEQKDLYLLAGEKVPNAHPEIIAYTAQGRHLTQEQYFQEINIALWQIEQGKTIADDDLQREVETW